MAYELIETVTLASAASSIEFTSIPQDGVDLLVFVSGRSSSNINTVGLVLNDTTENTTHINLQGNGSTASSTSFTPQVQGLITGGINNSSYTANTFSNASIYISNYTSSTAKSISADAVNENNATAANAAITALSSAETNPVTQVGLVFSNFVAGSTASLYKIF